MGDSTATVLFSPSGRRGEVEVGSSVLDAARRLGVDLDSVCGGRAICGRCQVIPMLGDASVHRIDSAPDHVSPVGEAERAYCGRRPLEPGARLGCVARLLGDLVVDVPPASQLHRPVVRKEVDLDGVIVDPVVTPHYVEVPAAALGSDRSDLRLLADALASQWGFGPLAITPPALAALQPALARGDRRVTVAVHRHRAITGVWPGLVDELLGVAIDVGSTTVAGHLCGLASGEVVASAGEMNPQIRFGEDLMSRVSYVMLHPGGHAELTEAIRSALRQLVDELCRQATRGDAPAVRPDGISDIVLVGNPIMHHLLLGIDPTPLGSAPFALATDLSVDATASDLELDCPFATVHVLPCIAGHVGADTAAAVLAVGPHRSDETVLLVDIGTNAEIVLADRGELLAASSPTGPAFEGAQISGGQRATPGAIDRVRIDPETLEPRVHVIGAGWSDAADFDDTLPDVGVTGICGSGVISAVARLYQAAIVDADGRIDGRLAARTPRVVPDGRTFAYVLHRGPPELRITQSDVRSIQLAKAALCAGARLLLDRAGLAAVERIELAGAFGSHIDPVDALLLGMVPDCEPDRVRSVGNAAGSGAVRALLSVRDRAEIAEVARRISKVETAIEPAFQEHFVQAMAFPHAVDPYERLAAVVPLPPRRAPARRRETAR